MRMKQKQNKEARSGCAKFGLVSIFRKRVKSFGEPYVVNTSLEYMNRYAQILANPIVEYGEIQQLAWNGIPTCIRPKIWKHLLKYAFINDAETILLKKRAEYAKLVQDYWEPDHFSEEASKIHHTIDVDVKRIGSEYSSVCRSKRMQECLRRVLFIWHNRHPASGYVQSMCDIAIPFLVVFLGEYMPCENEQLPVDIDDRLPPATFEMVEADIYWCVSKLMEEVTQNYTQGFNGLHIAYSRLEQSLRRIDPELSDHFTTQKIDLFALSFRSISTMLLRLFKPSVGIRLLDTYISYEGKYPELMIFLLIVVLEKFAEQMLRCKFDELMGFLQNLPTKDWNEQDIAMLVAEAYTYLKIYGQVCYI